MIEILDWRTSALIAMWNELHRHFVPIFAITLLPVGWVSREFNPAEAAAMLYLRPRKYTADTWSIPRILLRMTPQAKNITPVDTLLHVQQYSQANEFTPA